MTGQYEILFSLLDFMGLHICFLSTIVLFIFLIYSSTYCYFILIAYSSQKRGREKLSSTIHVIRGCLYLKCCRDLLYRVIFFQTRKCWNPCF